MGQKNHIQLSVQLLKYVLITRGAEVERKHLVCNYYIPIPVLAAGGVSAAAFYRLWDLEPWSCGHPSRSPYYC